MYTGHIRLIDYAPIPHVMVVVKMEKITYHDAGGGEHVVQLGNKSVGTIKPVMVDGKQGGYAYYPKGAGRNRTKGETFATVAEVKASLEEQ